MNTKPLMVLFLSSGNAARSILAEAILRQKGSNRFSARSAGYRPTGQVHPHTLAMLSAEGIDTSGLHSKGWGEFLASAHILPIDVIVTLSEEAKQNCPVWSGAGFASRRMNEMADEEKSSALPGPVRVHWPVDDPLSAEKEDVREWKFRKCFLTLENRISALIKNRAAQNPSELLLQLKDIGMVV